MPFVQPLFSSRGAPDALLRRLYVLRNIAIIGQTLTALTVHYWLAMHLPLVVIGCTIGGLGLFNVLTLWRSTRTLPVTNFEIVLQLLVDVAALTGILYLSGGAANPFVSLYLLPLVIAAVTLPRAYAGAMTGVTIVCYTLLMFQAVPLPMHHGPVRDFNLHLLGMWFNFVVSAALIALFVTRMAASLRERDHMLAAAREENLRNERIVALGTFAAGAAHELGTPLTTMAVITRELEGEHADEPALLANIRCLRDQVTLCKRSLTSLVAASGHERAELERVSVEVFLDDMLEQWRLMRPLIPVTARWNGPRPSPLIASRQTLTQTVTSLFNNAADASPDGVTVEARWSDTDLAIEIRDRGPGVTPEVLKRAGHAFVTTKASGEGLGLGLFLANATVERLGGKVRLFNHEDGACTRVTLPLSAAGALA